MTELLAKAIDLLTNSFTLKQYPLERLYWLERVEHMAEGELESLVLVLEQEQQSMEIAQEAALRAVIEINKRHIAALDEIKHKALPNAFKAAEKKLAHEENAEDILNDLDNA